MRKTRPMIGLLAICLLVAGSAQAGLITNGNFDADTVPDGTETQTVSNWTMTSSSVYNPPSSSTLQPYSGDNLMYMSNTLGGNGASQAISMVEGQQYKITARVRNFPNNPYVTYAMSVWDTGMTTMRFGVSDFLSGGAWTSGPSGDTATWTLVESNWYTATAADASCVLTLGTYDGTATIEKYACFDNVDVVPEPATLSLLGLGGALALIRRKRA